MLKAPSVSRSSSQSSSPVFHHASSSPRSLSHRTSVPKPTSGPAGYPREVTRWVGVDAATQWSPGLPFKMPTPSQPTPVQVKQDSARLSTILDPTSVPAPESPVIQAETPGSKRKSDDGKDCAPSSPVVERYASSPSKRVRSASSPITILPAKYEFCDVEDIVILIANMISELIQTNDCLPLRTSSLTRFHSKTPPGISVQDYLQRLAKHATLTPPLLLSMVYYIDRLCSSFSAFTITSLTVHRFLITAATVASKGLSDSFWNNPTYARVGGLKVEELGQLELEFLHRVDWKIVPVPETLVDYYRGLVERSEGYGLEDQGVASDDDLEGENVESEDSDPPLETATESKWNAWMVDVSSQQAEMGNKAEKGNDEVQADELQCV